jgi:hypothetical protein
MNGMFIVRHNDASSWIFLVIAFETPVQGMPFVTIRSIYEYVNHYTLPSSTKAYVFSDQLHEVQSIPE